MAGSTYLAAALLIGMLAAGVAVVGAATESAPPPRPAPPPDVDITADVKAWNSDKFASPPTQFKQGHTTPRKLDEKAVRTTDTGFVVQLPSKAPIPTPTVYKGRVCVGGGFHSKEFYCFDAKTGAVVWAVNLDDDGPTSAVCDDGVTIFNTESCTLFAVDADTGKHLWSHWLGDPLTSTPTIANGVVFTSYPAAGRGGQRAPAAAKGNAPPCSHVLIALELKTGKILWQRWLESDVMSAPVAADGELYATSFGGVVYKFAQKDGTVLSAVRTRATSAPVVVGKEVYFTRRTDDGTAAAECVNTVNRADTREKFAVGKSKKAVYLDGSVQAQSGLTAEAQKLDAANGLGANPTAAAGPANAAPQAANVASNVNPGANPAPGVGFGGFQSVANARAAYENVGQGNISTMQAFQGSRVLSLGGKNFNCMGDTVACTDPKTGAELWSHKLSGDLVKEGGFLGAPPAAAGGHLIMTTLKGDVLRMDPATGKVVKTWSAGGPTRFQPAVEGGRVYVGTQDGKLVCIDTGDATLTGWPCWGGNPAHTGVAGK